MKHRTKPRSIIWINTIGEDIDPINGNKWADIFIPVTKSCVQAQCEEGLRQQVFRAQVFW